MMSPRAQLHHDPFHGNEFRLPFEESGPFEELGLGRIQLVLLCKRMEHSAFRWPPICDGVIRLSASQLAALMDGLESSRLRTRDIATPTATLRTPATDWIRLATIFPNGPRIGWSTGRERDYRSAYRSIMRRCRQ